MTSLLGNGSTIARLMLPKQFLSMNGVGGCPLSFPSFFCSFWNCRAWKARMTFLRLWQPGV